MSLELIKQVVTSFVQDSKNDALLLRGRWGIGKTFFWQRLVEEEALGCRLGCENYAYVSLFGLTSLEDLKAAILVSRIKSSKIVAGHGGRSLDTNEILKQIKDLPKVKEWTGGLAASLAFLGVRDALICFDDLERKGQGLDFREIFGLMSILKDQRNCKMAVIANEDTLEISERESFHRYSEKLVDINLEFLQTPENAFGLVFDPEAPYRKILEHQCLEIGIVNIRILQRLRHLVLGLASLLRDSEEDVARHTLYSLVIFVWCFYDRTGAAPPFEYVKGLDVELYVKIEHEKEDTKEKAWNRLLNRYGYSYTTEMNLLLANYVERGYFATNVLAAQLNELNKISRAGSGRQRHWEAWSLYTDSFNDNEEDFLRFLLNEFRVDMAHLTLNELDTTVVILRKLDRGEEADRLIDEHLAMHRDDLEGLKPQGLVFPLVDARLRQRLVDLVEAIPDRRDLGEIIKRITTSRSYHPDDLTFLANSPVEDYRTFFSSERSPELRAYVKRCLEFGHDASSEQTQIASKTADALRMLGSESRINRVRIEDLYRITMHDDKSPTEEKPSGEDPERDCLNEG